MKNNFKKEFNSPLISFIEIDANYDIVTTSKLFGNYIGEDDPGVDWPIH